ncbi:MAG: sulfurtransferase [Alphaproteobacteria bacterium HGW-Alphaproteobacteria-8]|nr:MAG: sulfurtransferase [Alphaproteobacteria bacterium HGW-Alphaproteobacteria-8]
MATEPREGIEQAAPEDAWSSMESAPKSLLVDVRTRPEWAFVGAPDLSPLVRDVLFAEWLQFPAMTPNPRFIADLDAAVTQTGAETVYFICRSGARSQAAATAAQAHFASSGRAVRCVNVLEGFEGDLDASGRRGARNGWKARGLPWRQS